MWTKPYGRTAKDISVISFGGMRFPEPAKIDKMAEIVTYAHSRGINYFDTAPQYCDDKSEDIFGTAFKHMARERFYASTKCSAADGGKLRQSLEKSLTRMGLERIDFFHIWCVVTLGGWQERLSGGAVAEALKARDEGLIGHVAISSHLHGGELANVLAEGRVEGVTLGYCALNFPYRQDALDAAAKLGLGVVVMNPLAGGLIPNNPERFQFIRGPADKTVVQAALRFVVSSPAVTSALVGFSSIRHVDEAVESVENFRPYSAAHVEALRDKIVDAFDGLCTGCGYCLPCPEGVPIPKLMDAYNHKLLRSNQTIPQRLNWHWNLKPEAAKACTLCGACETKCTQHLPIRQRMQEIAALA